METESPEAIENGLMNLRDAAARLAKSGDWLNAGAIYNVALDEAVAGYNELVQSMDSHTLRDVESNLCGSSQAARSVSCSRVTPDFPERRLSASSRLASRIICIASSRFSRTSSIVSPYVLAPGSSAM